MNFSSTFSESRDSSSLGAADFGGASYWCEAGAFASAPKFFSAGGADGVATFFLFAGFSGTIASEFCCTFGSFIVLFSGAVFSFLGFD